MHNKKLGHSNNGKVETQHPLIDDVIVKMLEIVLNLSNNTFQHIHVGLPRCLNISETEWYNLCVSLQVHANVFFLLRCYVNLFWSHNSLNAYQYICNNFHIYATLAWQTDCSKEIKFFKTCSIGIIIIYLWSLKKEIKT